MDNTQPATPGMAPPRAPKAPPRRLEALKRKADGYRAALLDLQEQARQALMDLRTLEARLDGLRADRTFSNPAWHRQQLAALEQERRDKAAALATVQAEAATLQARWNAVAELVAACEKHVGRPA